jgi:hypothetical protein
MDTAERNHEFVVDLAAERPRLPLQKHAAHKSSVVIASLENRCNKAISAARVAESSDSLQADVTHSTFGQLSNNGLTH